MNSYQGTIQSIDTSGSLSLVKVDVKGVIFSAIIIDTPESLPKLKVKNNVHVVFKESEVVLAKAPINISLQNRVSGKVSAVDSGKLLTKVTVESPIGSIVALITTSAVSQLDIKPDSAIMALIKTNEVMLSYD